MIVDIHVTLSPEGVDVEAVVNQLVSSKVDAGVFYGYNEAPPVEEVQFFADKVGLTAFFGIEFVMYDGRLLWIPEEQDKLKSPPPIGPLVGMGMDLTKFPGLWIATHPYDRGFMNTLGDSVYIIKGLGAVETTTCNQDETANNMAINMITNLGLKALGGTGIVRDPRLVGFSATFVPKYMISTQKSLIDSILYQDVWPVEILRGG